MSQADQSAAWTRSDLRADPNWIFEINEQARLGLTSAVRRVADPAKTLLNYRRDDFELGSTVPFPENRTNG